MNLRHVAVRAAMSLACAFSAGCGGEPTIGDPPKFVIRVAAASDLQGAFDDIAREFGRGGTKKASLTFGASGLLARQIEEGAPFDVFAPAHVRYANKVLRHCDRSTLRLFARGTLGIWYRRDRSGEAIRSLEDLANAPFSKVAVANPEHAPYGHAAEQAMRGTGTWDRLQDRLVLADNVLQAFQFANTGNADAALVSKSVTIGAKGVFVPIPEHAYEPLAQALIVCAPSDRKDAARAFVSFVQSPFGQGVLRRYGFTVLP